MIHRQMTNYNQNTDPNNWANRMWEENELTDHQKEDKKRILNWWVNQANKPELRDYERKEMELMRRISAASEGDNIDKRAEIEKKERAAVQAISDHYMKKMQGETEEEFERSRSKWYGEHRKVVEKARKEAGL